MYVYRTHLILTFVESNRVRVKYICYKDIRYYYGGDGFEKVKRYKSKN